MISVASAAIIVTVLIGMWLDRGATHDINITHTTVQVGVEGCDANDMYCMGRRSGNALR